MEASAPGSKKKKATGGGFPPADTITVTATEGDTAIAIRGKPAHSEEARTKGSEVAAGGSSGKSGGIGDAIEKAGHDVIKEAGRLPGNLYEQPLYTWTPLLPMVINPFIPGTEASPKDIFNEGKRVPGNIPKLGQQLYDDMRKQGQATIKDIERVPGGLGEMYGTNIFRDYITAPAAKGIEAEYKRGLDQVGKAEDKAGAIIGDALDKGGKQLEDAGKKAGQWLDKTTDRAGSDILKGAKQLEDAGKKIGGTLGKAGKDVGGVLSDAEDAAGKAADKASDWVSDTAQQGEDAASDAGSSAAETVCDWFGC
jgi:hypothetical protein